MRLTMLWMMGVVPAALAQEVGPPPTSESPSVIEEIQAAAAEAAKTVETAQEAAPEAAADAAEVQAVEISVQLANGMTLKGTAPLNEVMVWSKGSPLHFTPAGGV